MERFENLENGGIWAYSSDGDFVKHSAVENRNKDFYDQLGKEQSDAEKQYSGEYGKGVAEGLRLALVIFNQTI